MRKTFILILALSFVTALGTFRAPASVGVTSAEEISTSTGYYESATTNHAITASSSTSSTSSPTSSKAVVVKPFISNMDESAQESVENGTRGLAHGHQWIDMGLPSGLKWATANIGADNAVEYGTYFAWGEVAPKDNYTVSNCKTYRKNVKSFSGNVTYDAARAIWGGQWRTPTFDEFQELRDNCEYKRIIRDGKKYAVFISKINGNELYFPQSGYMDGSTLRRAGQNGFYWSASPCVENKDAHSVYFVHDDMLDCYRDRAVGCAIRPVMK